MRRLTLILSDLYLPEEATRDASFPAGLTLPEFDWLLRFADQSRISDWRRALAADLQCVDIANLPIANVAAHGLLPPGHESVWLATPVRLEARLDHVRLVDRGLPRLDEDERRAWCEDFARTFSPYALHDAGPRGFLLTGLAAASVGTIDPARVLDADIGHVLPAGANARELRRLAAEVEMWMHSASINLERERARLPRLSSLWLWGGGANNPTRKPVPGVSVSVCGEDPWLQGFSRAIGARQLDVPPNFAALNVSPEHVVAELRPMSGAAHESLASLESGWFAPVRAALATGVLTRVDIVANDRWFRINARSRFRLWRRDKPWLLQLGGHATSA